MKKYRKPHRFKKKKPLYCHRFFWLSILSVILISSIFYFFFLADFFQVEKISIAGSYQIPEDQLIFLIEAELGNKVLFFSSRSIFLLDFNKMKKDILGKFPQIASIEIHRDFPDGLKVSVVERKGVATFCKKEDCFLLDKEGIAFERANGDFFQPLIRDFDFEDGADLGKMLVTEKDLVSILKINSKLADNLDIFVEEFKLFSREKLTVMTREGWELYFNLIGDVDWQLIKLKVLLEEKIPPEKRKELEWIELRFGNFANPKYRDQSI